MPDTTIALEIVDFSRMELSTDPSLGAMISGEARDGKTVKLLLSGGALAKLESLLARANLERAKHHQSH